MSIMITSTRGWFSPHRYARSMVPACYWGQLAGVASAVLLSVSSVAHAQSAISTDRLDAEYTRIRAAVIARYDEIQRTEEAQELHSPDADIFVVFDCGYTDGLDFQGGGDPAPGARGGSPGWAAVLFHVAKAAAAVNDAAKRFGYPEKVWEPLLSAYEKGGLAKAKQMAGKDLRDANAIAAALPPYPENVVRAMESYRVKLKKSGPRLLSQEGCGAGEWAVKIVTDPKAKVLRLIPEFFAMLCEQSGRAQFGANCPYWHDAPQQSQFYVSGVYRYVVTWPDGGERTGKVDFDKLAGDPDNPTFRLTK